MNSQGSPRQQLIEAIPYLSDRQVFMVLQLIQTLQAKPAPDLSTSSDDPLSEFIGASTNGSLAEAIDEKLFDLTDEEIEKLLV